jgi:O-antigen/teichoic acid export membrane protein
MFRNIIGTISTRLISALISLVTILLTGWFLGAEKMGTISLIILAITLVQMLNNFVGGGALVYLLPRNDMIKLFIPAYGWSVFTACIGTLILHLLHRIPAGYSSDVFLLSLFLSFSSVNYMILMGQERIKSFNIVNLVQVVSFFIVLIFGLFIVNEKEVRSYLFGLYCSYTVAFLLSLIMVMKNARWGEWKGAKPALKEIFRLGAVMQTGNVIQFFNYRISYYFLEFFMGLKAVGIYSMGVQLSESLWLVGKSIHMVQYSRISNEQDEKYAARLTLNLAKASFVITLITLFLLYLALILFFPVFFKPEFSPVKTIMAYLSFGILTFSVSIILSPYFSGMGKPVHNTISAAIALLFTVVLGWLLIPGLGYTGAAISASVSYTVATLYQLIIFVRVTKISAGDFLLKKTDISEMIEKIRFNDRTTKK